MNRTVMVEQLREWAKQLESVPHGATAAGVFEGMRAVADDLERTPPTVWVLEISHRHGVDVTVHATEEAARGALVNYCLDWWNETELSDPS
jgi:hypothetical protein